MNGVALPDRNKNAPCRFLVTGLVSVYDDLYCYLVMNPGSTAGYKLPAVDCRK
jgi:hypothetical protein